MSTSFYTGRKRMYRRKHYSGPTTVTLHYQQLTGLYAIKFHDTNHWDEMQAVITVIKTSPHGVDRDYDPETKTWFITEDYFEPIKTTLEQFTGIFNLDVLKKPENTGLGSVKIPDLAKMKAIFNALANCDVNSLEYGSAKKYFFKAAMRLHPDKNDGDGSRFYELNEAWQELEIQHYKTKQRVTELKDEGVQTYG